MVLYLHLISEEYLECLYSRLFFFFFFRKSLSSSKVSYVSCVDILGVKLCKRICVRDLDTYMKHIIGVTTESGVFYYVANNVVLVRLFSYNCACTLSRCGQ